MFANAEQPSPSVVPDFLIFNSPRTIFAFLLAGVPEHALRSITHLRIQFPGLIFEPSNEVHEAYLAGIRILLRLLPNLQDLVLLWTGISPRVFDGVEFRLTALTCTMALDEFEGLKFLTMQDGLTLLELPYWQSSGTGRPFFPREALLPDLNEVSLPPAGVMQLVPGRPVRSVDIRLVGRRPPSRQLRLPPFGTSAINTKRTQFEPASDMDFGEHEGPDLNFDHVSDSERHDQYRGPHEDEDEDAYAGDQDFGGEPEPGLGDHEEEPVTQLEAHEWPALMRALRESAAVVDDLALATLDRFDPDVVLRAVAANLPYLRALYVRVYTPADTTQVRALNFFRAQSGQEC